MVFLTTSVVFAADFDFSNNFKKFVDEGDMPGAVLIVATPTEILSTESIGWADVASKTPINENTQFWIASNTKAVVAAATMICVDEGLLDLDAPVEQYLPQLKDLKVGRPQEDGSVILTPVASKPTLRQALSHTAGLRFITTFQERYGIDSLPVERLMTTVGMSPLIDEPGARYSYSNLGIDIAQAAVEAVTGVPFEEFLQKRIFDPRIRRSIQTKINSNEWLPPTPGTTTRTFSNRYVLLKCRRWTMVRRVMPKAAADSFLPQRTSLSSTRC